MCTCMCDCACMKCKIRILHKCTQGAFHVASSPGLTQFFNACNIEKLSKAWGRGYFPCVYDVMNHRLHVYTSCIADTHTLSHTHTHKLFTSSPLSLSFPSPLPTNPLSSLFLHLPLSLPHALSSLSLSSLLLMNQQFLKLKQKSVTCLRSLRTRAMPVATSKLSTL